MRYLTVLGATGSIGASALDIVRQHPDRYAIYALTAHTQIEKLLHLCLEFKPAIAVVATAQDAAQLAASLRQHQRHSIDVVYGSDNLVRVSAADKTDIVIAAIVGAAGLSATLAAAQAGKRILLANKEALVMSGELFMRAVKSSRAELLPIDSEHNAVFQCLPSNSKSIKKITLTASGGPFRTWLKKDLNAVTPEQACAHPNWRMGKKISVDSATMMNKGLEVIEAHWLFSLPAQHIDVVIHPQSIIHAMVTYLDGSVLAQMSHPDMRIPIAHALAYPERISTTVPDLDWGLYKKLEFDTPDLEHFPCLQLAFDAMRQGGGAAVLLNAANEVAVAAFLDGKIRFTAIAQVVEQVLTKISPQIPDSLEAVLELDCQARVDSQKILQAYIN